MPTQTVPALRALPAQAAAAGGVSSLHLFALDSLAEAIIATDTEGRISYLERRRRASHRCRSAGSAIGKMLEEIIGLVDETDRRLLSDPVKQALTTGAPVNLSRRALLLSKANGSERSIELSASPIRNADKEVTGAVILLHDVTELRGLARQMSYQATHDALTGLVNRREFERRLEEAVESGHRGDGQHVLCYIDLDRFKVVNDTSGHLAGDSMLREVAKLLRDAVRDSDTVARLGGDEFGMLLIGCPLEKARQIADDVCRAVGGLPLRLEGPDFQHRHVGRSRRGVARERHARRAAGRRGFGLLRGEEAGHAAASPCTPRATKRSRATPARSSGCSGCRPRSRKTASSSITSPSFPRSARIRGGPAMEVLVRLQDEEGHEVPPSEFVRAAERYRLMGLVDRWVVQTTLAALGRGAIPVPADAQRRHQHLRADARRHAVPRVRRGVPRQHRRLARAGVLRDHRERGGGEHGSRAPLRRRAAWHGLPVRAG